MTKTNFIFKGTRVCGTAANDITLWSHVQALEKYVKKAEVGELNK